MNKQYKYEVAFYAEELLFTIELDTPLVVDCEHEDNVHTIIDMAIEIAKLQKGNSVMDSVQDVALQEVE